MKDVIFAWRTLRANLGFAAVAIITLALGVGANTAIFSVVKAVLLNQLPYAHPERVVAISEWEPAAVRPENVDFTTTYDLRAQSRSFANLSLYRSASAALVDRGEPELINGSRVNYDFFSTLGVPMQLGRAFLPEEDRPDRRAEVILSHDLWMRRFGADAGIIGRTIRLNESTYTVVGILPAAFRPADIPAWTTLPRCSCPLDTTSSSVTPAAGASICAWSDA